MSKVKKKMTNVWFGIRMKDEIEVLSLEDFRKAGKEAGKALKRI
jgi:hypothetical protein